MLSKLETIADNLLHRAFYNRVAFENGICEERVYNFPTDDSLEETNKLTEYNLRQAIFYAETMKLTYLPSYETAKNPIRYNGRKGLVYYYKLL